VLRGPDGRPAIVGRTLLQLPSSPQDGRTLSLIDIRLDFDAMWPAAATSNDSVVPSELRVTVAELASYFTGAWRLAMTALPLAITDAPDDLTPAGTPRIEMYIVNERAANTGGDRILRTEELVDLAPFGPTTRTSLYDLSVGVIAPTDLSEPEVGTLVKSALIWMAEDFGFTEADMTHW